MTNACVTDAKSGAQATRLEFTAARPAAVALRLDAASIHVWRLAYARIERRAPLRRLLAGYLGTAPGAIELGEGDAGKPYLAGVAGHPEAVGQLDFNWSHSGDWALVAVTRHQAVGVDIERLTKPVRARELARRFFDPAEAAALEAMDGDANPAFIGLWCAKEAVLKAAGRGISFGLERLAFEPSHGLDWRLARVDPELGRLSDWRLAGFEAAPGYHGVLAWQGAPRRIEAFQMP